jgi:uncharacterized membrane protein
VSHPHRQDDFHIEHRLGAILRAGVTASSACLAAGLLVFLISGGAAAGTWLMLAGLVMLLATPVARVALSVYEYALHRDWTFFILTTIVLLELCGGIVAALVFHQRL